MTKLLCPYCNKVINYEGEDISLICPHCEKEIYPDQSAKYYNMMVNKYFNYANVALYSSTNYYKAIENFDNVLKIDSHNLDAIIGKTLAMLYTSTLNESSLKDVLDFISINTEDFVVNDDNITRLSDFVLKTFDGLKLYFDHISDYYIVKQCFNDKQDINRFIGDMNYIASIIQFLLLQFNNDKLLSINNIALDDINEFKEKVNKMSKHSFSLNENRTKSNIRSNNKDVYIFKNNRKIYKIHLYLMLLTSLFVLSDTILLILLFVYSNSLTLGIIAGCSVLITILLIFVSKNIKKKLTN